MRWSGSTTVVPPVASDKPREDDKSEWRAGFSAIVDAAKESWDQAGLRLAIALWVVVVGCIAAGQGDQAQIGEWGLIQALPLLYFASAALLTVTFFLELFRRDGSSTLVLAAHVIGMVVLLHGAPGFLEQEPRFATAWLHVGYTDQILDRGVAAPKVDARFNWPGFFGAAAAVTGAGGLGSALPLLRWAPVGMVLLYLPPIYVIGQHVGGSRRVAWLALWLFLLVNWVGQDYFAPQSIGFVLFLMAIAVMVTFFREGTRFPLGSRLSAWRDGLGFDGLPDVAAGPRLRVAIVVLLVLVETALAFTHQLSPIVLILASSALVLVGRLRLPVYPVIAGILTLGWISLAAKPYWVGHLHTIFGGVGDVNRVVDSSVGERIGGSAAHLDLLHLRLAYTGTLWALMVISALILWVRRHPPLTLSVLAAAPFVLVVQNYGSEGVLRIFLFSSPFACLIVAQLLVGLTTRRLAQVIVAVVAVALIPVFVLTRYGNESFEQVRPAEIEAIRTLYAIAPPGSDLVSPTAQIPWRFEFATDYDYSRPRDPLGFRRGDPGAIRTLVAPTSHEPPATYLVVTTGQVLYASEAEGSPSDWFERVRPMLTPANGYRLVYENPDAVIYQYQDPQ